LAEDAGELPSIRGSQGEAPRQPSLPLRSEELQVQARSALQGDRGSCSYLACVPGGRPTE